MTDAGEKVLGLVPLIVGAKIIDNMLDDEPRKRKNCIRQRRW